MGYKIKQCMKLKDLESFDIVIEDQDAKDIDLSYDDFHKIHNGLQFLLRKYNGMIILRKKLDERK